MALQLLNKLKGTTQPITSEIIFSFLIKKYSIDHFYSTNEGEIDIAINIHGYTNKNIECYIYSNENENNVPFYRVYNPYVLDHFYTTGRDEADNAIKKFGYINDENI